MPGPLIYHNAPDANLPNVSSYFNSAANMINNGIDKFTLALSNIDKARRDNAAAQIYRDAAAAYNNLDRDSYNNWLAQAAADTNRYGLVSNDVWKDLQGNNRVTTNQQLLDDIEARQKAIASAYNTASSIAYNNADQKGLRQANTAMLDAKDVNGEAIRYDLLKPNSLDNLLTSAANRDLAGARAAQARAAGRALERKEQEDRAYNYMMRQFIELRRTSSGNPAINQANASTIADIVKNVPESLRGDNFDAAVRRFYANAQDTAGNVVVNMGGVLMPAEDYVSNQINQAATRAQAAKEYNDKVQAERGANSFLGRNLPSNTSSGSNNQQDAVTSLAQGIRDMVNSSPDEFIALAQENVPDTASQRAAGINSRYPARAMFMTPEQRAAREQAIAAQAGQQINTAANSSNAISSTGSIAGSPYQNMGMDVATANSVSTSAEINDLVNTYNNTGSIPINNLNTTVNNIDQDFASTSTALNNSMGAMPGARLDMYAKLERGDDDALTREYFAQALGLEPTDSVLASNNVNDLAEAIHNKYPDIDINEARDNINRGIKEYGLKPTTAAAAVADAIDTQWDIPGFDTWDLDDSDATKNFKAARRLKNNNSEEARAVAMLDEAAVSRNTMQTSMTALRDAQARLTALAQQINSYGGAEYAPRALLLEYWATYAEIQGYTTTTVNAAQKYDNAMRGR